MAQVFADTQTQHRLMVVELPHCSGQTVRLVRSPLNFSASPVTHRAPPPRGEHSLQALREELGLSDAQVAGLVARGGLRGEQTQRLINGLIQKFHLHWVKNG